MESSLVKIKDIINILEKEKQFQMEQSCSKEAATINCLIRQVRELEDKPIKQWHQYKEKE